MREPQRDPVVQMTSRVQSARGTIIPLPAAASAMVASERPSRLAGSCGVGARGTWRGGRLARGARKQSSESRGHERHAA